jgi:tetratricopeptide (TPR) repeat protein
MRSIAALGLCLLLAIPSSLGAQTVEGGIALYNRGRREEAKKVFEAHYRLGRILLTRSFRNEDEPIEHMERAVDIDPANADYEYGLGAAYGLKAQDAGVLKQVFLAPKVKKAFERAVALNPRHIEARAGLAQYYFRAPGIMGGDVDEAWKQADTMITLDEVRGRAFKASLYESEKKSREAEEEYKTLLAHQPKKWQAWQATGYYYQRMLKSDLGPEQRKNIEKKIKELE